MRSSFLKLSALICIGLSYAFLKLYDAQIAQTLWAEDGAIFLNQAHELGIISFFIPYNGYFHLFPRLIAWISCFIDFSLTPDIFFAAWCLAYGSLIYIVILRALQFSSNYWEIGALLLCMLAQPHTSEVFFTLTNSQWFLGCSLAIYLLIPMRDNFAGEKLFLLLCVLTGPFVIILTPFVLGQLLLFRDWKLRKQVYLIVGLGDIVQLTTIFTSHRLTGGALDTDLYHWLTAYLNFFSFGATSVIGLLGSVFFWSTYSFGLYKSCTQRSASNIIVFSLTAAALLFFTAGLLACKNSPQTIDLTADGARYYYIPYVLVLFATWLLFLKQTKFKLLLFVFWGLLCMSSFNTLKRTDFMFDAYAEFAKHNPNLLIPINPSEARYPAWGIQPHALWGVDYTRQAAKIIPLNYQIAEMIDIVKVQDINQRDTFKTLNENAYITFSIENLCPKAKYLGFEAHIVRQDPDWVRLSWSGDGEYNSAHSLRQFYTSGDMLTQFAFRAYDTKFLRLYPLAHQGLFQIVYAHLYCL